MKNVLNFGKVKHATPEDTRDIQLAVHEIAKKWLGRGLCPDCIVRQIITGASCVAMDARDWPEEAVHKAVEEAFSPNAEHIRHGQH